MNIAGRDIGSLSERPETNRLQRLYTVLYRSQRCIAMHAMIIYRQDDFADGFSYDL